MIKVFTVWILLLVFLFAACSTKPPKKTSNCVPAVLQMQQVEEEVDLDRLFEELAQSGERSNEELDRIKLEQPEMLLDYLMTCFLNGELEDCQYNDGSASYSKFVAWDSMLGGESMPLETETPLEYWQQWCALGERTCDGETCDLEFHTITHRYLALIKERNAELDNLFEELANSGERTNEELERIKSEQQSYLLDYLMSDFISGELEGCRLDDDSVGTLKFYTWSGFLGMESIELVLESPQQYWEAWSSHVKRIYDLNGMEFMEEQNYPMGVRYILLLSETSDGIV